ncbi:MAG: L-type lectin-domain containing protein, partial [Acidimicrobiia bacterium]
NLTNPEIAGNAEVPASVPSGEQPNPPDPGSRADSRGSRSDDEGAADAMFDTCLESLVEPVDSIFNPMAYDRGDDDVLDHLWAECAFGTFTSCDLLYAFSPVGSNYEAFASTCGDLRVDPSVNCMSSYGDGVELDIWRVGCTDGDYKACELLYQFAPEASQDELFGMTCGLRIEASAFGCLVRSDPEELTALASLGTSAVAAVAMNQLELVGSATPSPTRGVRLTKSLNQLQAGAAWLNAKQAVGDGFRTSFRFQITDVPQNPGDGFAFVVQNTARTAIGDEGIASGNGYKGIPNSVAIEFDTTLHDYEGETNGNHIAVHTVGTEPNTAHRRASLGGVVPAIQLYDGQVHFVEIVYAPGTLTVLLDNNDTPVLEVSLDLATRLSLDEGTAWVGFTASTEPGFREAHDVFHWSFTPTST